MSQLALHKNIDELVDAGPDQTAVDTVLDIISTNDDAKDYFYSRIDERWFDWLWSNEFLDVISEQPNDQSDSRTYIDELQYLVRMGTVVPEQVVEFIHSIKYTQDNLNVGALDYILRICSELPVEQLVRTVGGRTLIEKIHHDHWVPLMGRCNHHGFEYKRITNTLRDGEAYDQLVLLLDAMLAIKPSEECKFDDAGRLQSNPFYFDNLSYTGVLHHLVQLPDDYLGQALRIAVGSLTSVSGQADNISENDPFTIQDQLYFYDIDLYNQHVTGSDRHLSFRDDLKDLLLVVRDLTDRHFRSLDDPDTLRFEYSETIESLPDTRTMWRLRLFSWHLQPEVFTSELKQAFYFLFDDQYRYLPIMSGVEYCTTLQRTFDILTTEEKRTYINRVITYFTSRDGDDKDTDIGYGSRVLSSLSRYLEEFPDLADKATSKGFRIEPDYTPEPSIVRSWGGVEHPRAPMSEDEFKQTEISEIARLLNEEWTPEALQGYNTEVFPQDPINASGVGRYLQNDIPTRFSSYLSSAHLFIGDNIDPHYTYSFLRGIESGLQSQQNDELNQLDFTPLFTMCSGIITAYNNLTEEQKINTDRSAGYLLVGWLGVSAAMVDVVRSLIRLTRKQSPDLMKPYRSNIVDILSFGLNNDEPTPEDEEPGTAMMSGDMEKQVVSDPFSIAINSVRGRAFETLILQIEVDGEELRSDTYKLYKQLLRKENTRAIMFLYGHYLAPVFFRSKQSVTALLREIFSADQSRQHLYQAAWEGYLSSNLYEELFFLPEMQELYRRSIHLRREEHRQYHRDLNEGLAVHIALAIVVYFSRFTIEDPLFREFWSSDVDASEQNERRKAFVSAVGRVFINRDSAEITERIKAQPDIKRVLRELWDWILENETDPNVLSQLGFWIDIDKGIFTYEELAARVAKTLELSKGALKWDYGLTKSIERLAAESPRYAHKITHHYFLDEVPNHQDNRRSIRYNREWYQAIETLYNHPDTKDDTYSLIDKLIEYGGRSFWELKNILNENNR